MVHAGFNLGCYEGRRFAKCHARNCQAWLSNRGLTLRMARTKTTGGAKLHGPICAFVARDITISGYDWLIEGF